MQTFNKQFFHYSHDENELFQTNNQKLVLYFSQTPRKMRESQRQMFTKFFNFLLFFEVIKITEKLITYF